MPNAALYYCIVLHYLYLYRAGCAGDALLREVQEGRRAVGEPEELERSYFLGAGPPLTSVLFCSVLICAVLYCSKLLCT